MRNVDRNDNDYKGGGNSTGSEKKGEEITAELPNAGTLIVDATVADADIKLSSYCKL